MGIALVLGAGACKRWQVRRPRLRQSRSVLLGARDRERLGCARLALRLAPNDAHTTRLLNKIHTTYPDAADESDDHVMGELALQGVPTSPSAEIAICLIMCATDAASDGDKQEATRLTVRARDLVGEEACAAIIKLVRESDAELNAERKAKREAAGSNADGAKEAGDAQ